MKSKSGKTSPWLVIGGLALVAMLGFLVYGVLQQSGGGNDNVPTGGSSGCNVNPSVVVSVVDTLNPGSTVSTTNSYRVNGVYQGTTAPTVVSKDVDVLFNASGYIAKIKRGNSIGCGANPISSDMYAYANATLTYYSDNGLTALSTDGLHNETVKTTTGSGYNWKLHFQGTDKKSTGKMLMVVELSTPANISSVTLSGASSTQVPNGYNSQITNGYKAAFILPEMVGNTASDLNLAATAATGKVISSGTVYTSVYALEPFVETDGTFSDNNLAFNSVNTAKHRDLITKNFYIYTA